MKLELKHLAPYLPYGLKIHLFGTYEKDICTLSGIDENFELQLKECGEWYIEHDSMKPILRPLSGLTKEIEVNGEKFVPNDILNKRFRPMSMDLVPYRWLDGDFELDIQTENYSQTINLFDGFLIVQQLFEWHFDVFGLIENNLAIDINTIEPCQ
jgi:hypothetical protein